MKHPRSSVAYMQEGGQDLWEEVAVRNERTAIEKEVELELHRLRARDLVEGEHEDLTSDTVLDEAWLVALRVNNRYLRLLHEYESFAPIVASHGGICGEDSGRTYEIRGFGGSGLGQLCYIVSSRAANEATRDDALFERIARAHKASSEAMFAREKALVRLEVVWRVRLESQRHMHEALMRSRHPDEPWLKRHRAR